MWRLDWHTCIDTVWCTETCRARNVLVEADGTFVLADLGLCQEADVHPSNSPGHATIPAAVAPTTIPLRWCSPDYLSTWRFTGSSDVWSLGVTLWECTSGGRLPYDHITVNTSLQQLLEAGRLRLTVDEQWVDRYQDTDERGLAVRVVRLIERCLTVEVEQRPSAEQLVGMVQHEIHEWEAECGKQAERVKRQWADDHTTLVRHMLSEAAAVSRLSTGEAVARASMVHE